MSPVEFEPMIPTVERPQTYALRRHGLRDRPTEGYLSVDVILWNTDAFFLQHSSRSFPSRTN
jgi:hypothetical protein